MYVEQPGNAAGKKGGGGPATAEKLTSSREESSMDLPAAVGISQRCRRGQSSELAVRRYADRSLPLISRHPPARPW